MKRTLKILALAALGLGGMYLIGAAVVAAAGEISFLAAFGGLAAMMFAAEQLSAGLDD